MTVFHSHHIVNEAVVKQSNNAGKKLEPVAFTRREWTMNTPYSVIGQAAHNEQWTPPSCLAPCLIMTTSTTADSVLLFMTYMSINTAQIKHFRKDIENMISCAATETVFLYVIISCYMKKKPHVAYVPAGHLTWNDVVLLSAYMLFCLNTI